MVRAGIITATRGTELNISRLTQDITGRNAELRALEAEARRRQEVLAFVSRTGEVPPRRGMPGPLEALNDEQLALRIANAKAELEGLNRELENLNRELDINALEDAARGFADAEKAAGQFQKGIRESADAAKELQRRSLELQHEREEMLRQYIESVRKTNEDIIASEQKAGDELILLWRHRAEMNRFWFEQAQEFRERVPGQTMLPSGEMIAISPEAIRAGEQEADRLAKKIIDNMLEVRRQNEDFLREFRKGAGEVWDVFATRGQNVLTSLTNLARGLLNTIGRTLFQNFATGLLTGSRGTAAGGLAGAAANFGAGLGLQTGLGAIFGGGSAAAAPLVSGGLLNVGAAVPPTLAAPSLAGGGLAGALGLGGGSGLFGLGSLTIPVIGPIIAGVTFGLSKLFGRRNLEAPFTRDPYEAERSRTIFFFTSAAEAFDRLSRSIDRFSTLPPGQIVIDGLPAALESSNQFRRETASIFLGDEV
jgi:hypothetical protein